MPKPIAKTCAELHQWLRDYCDPELAALLVVGPDGYVYDSDDLEHCQTCHTTSLHEDITCGICEPCFQRVDQEPRVKRIRQAMVRRL
jgi:hypothetical protein